MTRNNITIRFLSHQKVWRPEGSGQVLSKVQKKTKTDKQTKNCQRNLFLAKVSSKSEGDIKTFPDKHKHR